MTDDILALYFMACIEIRRYNEERNAIGARAAFLVADNIYAQMTDVQRDTALDLRAAVCRKIDERLAADEPSID